VNAAVVSALSCLKTFAHYRGGITNLLSGDLFKAEFEQVFEDADAMKES